MADFDIAAAIVYKQEGPPHEDPHDPGGYTTWYGVAQAAHPELNVRALTPDQAKQVIRSQYWYFDGIASQRLANLLFSMSVNMGPHTAIGLLQRAAGMGVVDGKWGTLTEHAANGPDVLPMFVLKCIEYYHGLPQAPRYLAGWINRIISALCGDC